MHLGVGWLGEVLDRGAKLCMYVWCSFYVRCQSWFAILAWVIDGIARVRVGRFGLLEEGKMGGRRRWFGLVSRHESLEELRKAE